MICLAVEDLSHSSKVEVWGDPWRLNMQLHAELRAVLLAQIHKTNKSIQQTRDNILSQLI